MADVVRIETPPAVAPEAATACRPSDDAAIGDAQAGDVQAGDVQAGDVSSTRPRRGHDPASSMRVLHRATRVLALFVEDRESLSLSEIARAGGFPKSTAHRLATALCELRLLWRDPENESYRLGSLAVMLGHKAIAHRDLRQVARPVMRELARETGGTIVLAVLNARRDRALCIEQITRPSGLRLVADIGVELPLHAGGLSRVLLAHLDPEDIERTLSQPMARIASGTITDPVVLRNQIALARRAHYAFSVEETCDGVAGVTVPLFDADGQVLASLGLTGPRDRFVPPERWLPQLFDAVSRIADGVGGRVERPIDARRHADDAGVDAWIAVRERVTPIASARRRKASA